jgi:diadenosine tetraphosphate (Ap4A) HIT family hydrolase
MHEQYYQLHPQLKQDTIFIMDLALSQLLLMNDLRFPWLILVPRRMLIKELHELEQGDQNQLLLEITQISKSFQEKYSADKINIGALGNKVPQLHIHIIARFQKDPAWPSPVWGFEKPIPYSSVEAKAMMIDLQSLFMPLKNILPTDAKAIL